MSPLSSDVIMLVNYKYIFLCSEPRKALVALDRDRFMPLYPSLHTFVQNLPKHRRNSISHTHNSVCPGFMFRTQVHCRQL
jgi:hypothetical protein